MKAALYSVLAIMISFKPAEAAASFNCTQPPSFANYNVNACCRAPDINLGEAPAKCEKYVNSLSDNNTDYPVFAHVCYPECIYRETGSLINDEIDMERVKNFLKQNVNEKDSEIVPHIVHSFEKCLRSIKLHLAIAGIDRYATLPVGCSPYASMVYGCVNAETFMNCPASFWINERHCNLAKAFATQCNPLPHVPLPLIMT